MGRESDVDEVLADLDHSIVEWLAGEYPQYVPCTMAANGQADLVATPSPDFPGSHVVFSFFCSIDRAMASPSMQVLKGMVKFAKLPDEVTAYRFWLNGYAAYTDLAGTKAHGLLLLMNPRIPNDEAKPTLCLHCYLADIRKRLTQEGRKAELDGATQPMKEPYLKGGLIFDAGEM